MTNRNLESEPMTVRDALRIPALTRGRPELVAGAGGLDRTIRWAHAGEVANIADLLTGGELLLTTGLGIGGTPARQRRFADELARRGVAALALELGGTYRRAPAALVESLEQHDLPLIVLHREVRFVDITEAIHRAILGRQLELLRRGEDTHRRFTALLLEGAGVAAVLEALAATVRNPVLLERDGEIVAHATYRGDGVAALAGWSTSGALTLPIPSGQGASWGSLAIPPHDSPLGEEARIAAERAVAVLAVGLLRDREQELLAVGEHGRFLAALAAGEIDAGAAELEADALGFHHDGEWLLPLALAPRRGTRASSGAWTAFCRALRDELADRRIPALTGADERTPAGAAALLVAGLNDPKRRGSTLDQVARAVAAVAELTLGAPRGAVLAAGPALSGWGDAGELLREAAAAAALAVDDPPRPWHDASLPDLRHLLWELRDHASLRAFARRRLTAVLEHDARRPAAPLLPTLEALCDHGWRKADAARALHVERQSIYPRIDRLQRLLGADLGDARQRAALDIAVLARRLAERPAR